MISQRSSRTIITLIVCAFLALWTLALPLAAQQTKAIATGSAVDTQGVRYRESDYKGKLVPWLQDVVNRLVPDYPAADLQSRHEGAGLFCVTLDPKAGSVINVTVARSTGFSDLDRCAVAALRHWTWKPEKWKEICIVFHFEIGKPIGHIDTGERR